MKQRKTSISKLVTLASAVLIAVGGGTATAIPVLAADNAPTTQAEPAKQVTITVKYVDTDGTVISTKEHQIAEGDTIGRYSFPGDVPAEYGILDQADITNVQAGQILEFHVGKKFTVQFIYKDPSGIEVGRERITATMTD